MFRILWDGRKQRVKPWNSGPYLKVYIYGVKGTANKYNRKAVYVHRLVADHFLPPETGKKKFVHHLDTDERNNDVKNLTRTTLEENINAQKYFYKAKDGAIKRKRKKPKEQSKPAKPNSDVPPSGKV